MSPEEEKELHTLLTTFDVASIGEGDLNTGINLLTSMACVLANLAPADGTVVTRDGRSARLGASLLVCGSASAGRVIDEVITELGQCQTNLAAHLQSYLNYIEKQSRMPGANLPPTGPRPSAAETTFIATQSEDDPLMGTREEGWVRILNEPPSERVDDLARRPKILVSATKPRDLHNQLQGLRPGRPLVHLGIGCPDDFAELSDSMSALLEGRYSNGSDCQYVRANMLVTDPLWMIKKAAKAPDERTAWLGQVLWLCDGDAGPDPNAGKLKPQGSETTTGKFRRALCRVIARRLNMPNQQPIRLAADTNVSSVRWTSFLREMEPLLPGISFAARNLVDSLLFGLVEMTRDDPAFGFTLPGVDALGRLLVRRMANARATMMHASELAKRRSDIERVFWKLSHRRADARTIYRNLSLTAAQCDYCVRWLEEAGLVWRTNDGWELVKGARLDFKSRMAPLLEI